MNKKLNQVVKALIVVGMLIGAILMVYLTVKVASGEALALTATKEGKCLVVAFYCIALICFLAIEFIAWTLFKMMRSLDEDPFVKENVIALKRMGFAGLGIMGLGIVSMILRLVPIVVLVTLPIGICGLFSLVLSGVFERAVAYKQENDLTV